MAKCPKCGNVACSKHHLENETILVYCCWCQSFYRCRKDKMEEIGMVKLTKEAVKKAWDSTRNHDEFLEKLGLTNLQVAKDEKLSRKLAKLGMEIMKDEYREWRSQQIREGKRIAKECRERGITRLEWELEQLDIIKRSEIDKEP